MASGDEFVTEFLDLVERGLPSHLRDLCVGAVIDGFTGAAASGAREVAEGLSAAMERRREVGAARAAMREPQREFWYLGGGAAL